MHLPFEPDDTICITCREGCTCKMNVDPGCEHYACWGIAPTNTCPGVAPTRAIYAKFVKSFSSKESEEGVG